MMIPPVATSIPVKKSGITERSSGSESILVPVINNIADMTAVYTLNETGAFVWSRIDGVSSIAAIAGAVAGEFDTGYEVALADVQELISDMNRYSLVTYE